MKSKKASEMTINTVVIFVLALVLLAVSLYLIYTRILQPGQTACSFLDCKGTVVNQPCSNDPSCAACYQLPACASTGTATSYCCVKSLS